MSMEPRTEEQKLFDWKKSGTYSWKSHFPLGMRDGSSSATSTLPEKQATEKKKS